jgi:type II secretory pathway pseudopilin PulG
MKTMRINGTNLGRRQAFSLIEATIASTIAALMFGGIVYGYIQSSRNAEWSAYSFAAQSLAIQRLEQTRACRWDPEATPVVDELNTTNFPTSYSILDVPMTGSNVVYATNYTTITTISTAPSLRMISVDSVWKFINGRFYTNSIATYRAPDA